LTHLACLQLALKLVPLDTCQQDLGAVSYVVDDVRHRVSYNWGNNTLICAAKDYPDTFSGICGGDSGSPLVRRGTDPSGSGDTLVGVASFASAKCGEYARKPSERLLYSSAAGAARPTHACCAQPIEPHTAFGRNDYTVPTALPKP
jgi:hypothetical protein